MQILVWVEYEIVGDDEYIYIEKIQEPYYGIDTAWRKRFIRSLLARGILCTKIKTISVVYEE